MIAEITIEIAETTTVIAEITIEIAEITTVIAETSTVIAETSIVVAEISIVVSEIKDFVPLLVLSPTIPFFVLQVLVGHKTNKGKKEMKSVLIVFLFFSFMSYSQTPENDTIKLKLINVYKTTKNLYLAYPKLKKEEPSIIKTKNEIQFFEPVSRRLIKSIKIEKPIFTKEEEEIMKEKSIEKEFPYFDIIDGNYAIKRTIHASFYSDTTYTEAHSVKAELYNSKGIKVTELPSSEPYIVTSPKKDFFVVADGGEVPGDTVYFFTMEGPLFKKVKLSGGEMISITNDGKYVICWNNSDVFYVLNNKGEEIVQIDHHKQFKDHVANYFIINDCDKIFLKLFNSIVLLDKKGKVIWQKKSLRLTNSYFLDEQNNLLYCADFDKNLDSSDRDKNLVSISVLSGEIKTIIKNIDSVQLVDDKTVVIEKEGAFYEFQLN